MRASPRSAPSCTELRRSRGLRAGSSTDRKGRLRAALLRWARARGQGTGAGGQGSGARGRGPGVGGQGSGAARRPSRPWNRGARAALRTLRRWRGARPRGLAPSRPAGRRSAPGRSHGRASRADGGGGSRLSKGPKRRDAETPDAPRPAPRRPQRKLCGSMSMRTMTPASGFTEARHVRSAGCRAGPRGALASSRTRKRPRIR